MAVKSSSAYAEFLARAGENEKTCPHLAISSSNTADRHMTAGALRSAEYLLKTLLRAEFSLYREHNELLISCRKTSQICSLSGRTAARWSKLCQLLWCACDLSSNLLSYLAIKSVVTQWHIPQQQTYLGELRPDQCGQYLVQTTFRDSVLLLSALVDLQGAHDRKKSALTCWRSTESSDKCC